MTDFRPVGFIVGWLVLGLGAAMVPPLLLDLSDGNGNARGFAYAAVLAVLLGGSLILACLGQRSGNLDLRQGFLLTTASWTLMPAIGALPMMFGAPSLDFTDAYFEATSAFTTTGGTVIVGLENLPRGVLLWRGLMHWIGGIGVIVLAMILLPVLGVGGMQLLRNADFNTLGKILPRAKQIAVSIGTLYVGLTLVCGLAYVACGMTIFDAVVHAMSTLASGGMANYDSSFAAFSVSAQYVATGFMIVAALSFVRLVQLARGDVRAFLADSQIRTFMLVFLGFAVAIFGARLLNGAPFAEQTLREVLFNLASLMSSTGFASTDYTLWGPLALMLMFCTNLVGGCTGSTAGGIKIFRYQLLFRAISQEVRRLHSPNAVRPMTYEGRPVTAEVLGSVSAFFMVYFLSLGIITVVLVLLGIEPITAISGTAASLGNIGPGLGPQVGPAGNFATLPDAAKWILSFAMLLGRLEFMSVLVLLTPVYWRA